jgi:hypothetical protein
VVIKPIPVWINKVTSLSDGDILELTRTNLPVKPGVIDARRIEFEAANEICRLFGEELK